MKDCSDSAFPSLFSFAAIGLFIALPGQLFADTINVDINSGGSATEATSGGACDPSDTFWNGANGPEFSINNLTSADGLATSVGVRMRTIGDGTAITTAGGGALFSDGVEANFVEIDFTGLKPFKNYQFTVYQMTDGEGLTVLPVPDSVIDIPNLRPCFLDRWEPFAEHRNWRSDSPPSGNLNSSSSNPADLPGVEGDDFVITDRGRSDGFGRLTLTITRNDPDEGLTLAGFQICGDLKPFAGPFQPDLSLRENRPQGEQLFESRARLQWAKQFVRKRSDRKTRKFTLENAGTLPDRIQLILRDGSLRRTSRTVYRVNGKNRTAGIRRGRVTLNLTPEAKATIAFRITPKSKTLIRNRVENALTLTATSRSDRAQRDQIRFDSASGRYPTRRLERFCKPLDDLRDRF